MKNNFIPTVKQKKIINLSKGKHIVFAPAGSGKTEMLSHRVKQALAKGVKPEEMICLTFTNNAALNMRKRIGNSNELFIGNSHSFGAKFLFQQNLIPKQTNILDEGESRVLLEDAVEDVKTSVEENGDSMLMIKNNDLENFICWQNQLKLKLPNNLVKKSKKIFEKNYSYSSKSIQVKTNIKIIYRKYEKFKKDFLSLDFNDILNLALYFLIKDKTFRNIYTWVQVDEFQDLNTIQWEILNYLISKNCHTVLFGDTEQAIYSFLGADNSVLRKLKETYQEHFIAENHRSPQYLLELFNDYAYNNLKPTWSEKPFSKNNELKNNNIIFNLYKGNQFGEIDFILKTYIKPLIIEGKNPIAILMANNNLVTSMSNKCSVNNIKHFPVASFDLFQRKIIKDLIAFLNCLIGSKNR
ncbi:MAG: UvrD-helicase domain-containing protein [Candidatus Marinimicrobia bacterium]|nr:UvrD-helicase domain-containing protein [Candidatus Neomarinimicrobiota bacterium]